MVIVVWLDVLMIAQPRAPTQGHRDCGNVKALAKDNNQSRWSIRIEARDPAARRVEAAVAESDILNALGAEVLLNKQLNQLKKMALKKYTM